MNIDFKDEFTNSILNSMIQDLDKEQISKLKNILYMNINNYIIDKASTELIVYDEHKNNEILQTFLNTKLLEGKSIKTIERYHDIILPMLFEINKDIKDITTWDLRSYLSNYKIKRDVCENTLDGMRRIYTSFFGWLKKEEYIEKDPSERLQKIKAEKKVKTIISDEQFEVLKMNCDYSRDVALLNLLWCSGMRVGEIAAALAFMKYVTSVDEELAGARNHLLYYSSMDFDMGQIMSEQEELYKDYKKKLKELKL